MLPLSRGFAAEEWPADVEYLDQTAWPPGAERARSQRMRGVAIARVPRCHPSHPGAGLYATRRWEACEVLGEYTGRVAGPEREGAYVLALEPDVPPADSLSVDAEAAGNEARFINDYRGIAPAGPNVVFARTRLAGRPCALVVVTRPVGYGEEFVADYGDGFAGVCAAGGHADAGASIAPPLASADAALAAAPPPPPREPARGRDAAAADDTSDSDLGPEEDMARMGDDLFGPGPERAPPPREPG